MTPHFVPSSTSTNGTHRTTGGYLAATGPPDVFSDKNRGDTYSFSYDRELKKMPGEDLVQIAISAATTNVSEINNVISSHANGWYVVGYIGLAIFCALVVRVVLSFFKGLMFENNSFRTAFCGFGSDDKKSNDFGLPFFLAFLEFLSYPVLVQADAPTFIGAWLAFKTLPQWRVWKSERQRFNVFLLGNALVVVISFFLSWMLLSS